MEKRLSQRAAAGNRSRTAPAVARRPAGLPGPASRFQQMQQQFGNRYLAQRLSGPNSDSQSTSDWNCSTCEEEQREQAAAEVQPDAAMVSAPTLDVASDVEPVDLSANSPVEDPQSAPGLASQAPESPLVSTSPPELATAAHESGSVQVPIQPAQGSSTSTVAKAEMPAQLAGSGEAVAVPNHEQLAGSASPAASESATPRAAAIEPSHSDAPLGVNPVNGVAATSELVEASTDTASAALAGGGLIAVDSAKELSAGQMRKSDFLAAVREEVRRAVEDVIAPVGRSTADCPYLALVFEYFACQSARSIERTLRRFGSETSPITTLESAIAAIAERARQSAEVWLRTGKITGLPKGVPAAVAAAADAGQDPEAGLAAVRSALDGAEAGGTETTSESEAIQSRIGPGRALEAATKSRMESAFGHDFSAVRVHTDGTAGHLASKLSARAFTVGRHVAFKAGEYAPGTPVGDALLAHELAHVVQQRDATAVPDGKSSEVSSGQESLERDADQSSMGAMSSLWADAKSRFSKATAVAVPRLRSGLRLQRCKDDKKEPPKPTPDPKPADPFQGVTFALSNQKAKGVSPAANIRIAQDGGKYGLLMQGTKPADYKPKIKITAPSDARAAEFEVGIIQNLLSEKVEYTYTEGGPIRSTLPTPLKDGAPKSSGFYDEVFAENGKASTGILVPFTATGETARLELPDIPSDFAFVNLRDNPQCDAKAPAGTMTNGVFQDPFRTWVGVRHKPSGTVKTIHHIDWNIDFSATVDGKASPPTRTVTGDSVKVTESDGDGSPKFIQGGDVPADLLEKHRVCGP